MSIDLILIMTMISLVNVPTWPDVVACPSQITEHWHSFSILFIFVLTLWSLLSTAGYVDLDLVVDLLDNGSSIVWAIFVDSDVLKHLGYIQQTFRKNGRWEETTDWHGELSYLSNLKTQPLLTRQAVKT